ncbi:MAG: helix-turn-helix domain-containing protein [bacterium]|nr:helix-turn-helix domain-containing protein [bacterium]
MKAIAKSEAESLRHQGISIKEIARRVGVSQSTASRWCSDISLSPDQRNKLEMKRREAGARALAPWIRKNRELKRDDVKRQNLRGQKDIGRMTKRDLLILGLGLYWGEGYKCGSQEWGFTNSDPKIILATLAWLNRCYDIPVKSIIARLTINLRYKSQTERLINTWARETGIPRSQFGKPTFIQGYNSSKLNENTYRGTLRIKVRRGTSLRRRILASIAEASVQIAFSSRKTAS